ncbi:Pre-mRNA-splicing factor 18 [[Candida] zeylanoides]
MDFSNLVSKEVERKKRNTHNDRRRRLIDRKGRQSSTSTQQSCEPLHQKSQEERKESQEQHIEPEEDPTVSSHTILQQTRHEVVTQQPDIVEEPSVSRTVPFTAPTIPYNEEEIALAQELSEEQLDAKLAAFDELSNESNIPKLAKVRKLGILLRGQRKDQQYQRQLEQEDAVDMEMSLEEIKYHQLDGEVRQTLYLKLRKYLKYLVKCWESQLILKGDNTNQGAILYESKRDLVRLLHKLRKGTLQESIFVSLMTTMYYLQRQEFRRANEAYLKLSIGNAAWPIGVKSVGIHQRAADSKITGEDKKHAANIMVNDRTRRWITAIKRLITFCERCAAGSNIVDT